MLAMFRFRRRYSAFLVFAALITILIFRYQGANTWSEHQRTGAVDLSSRPGHVVHEGPQPPPSKPLSEELSEEEEKLKQEQKPKQEEKSKQEEKPKQEEKSKQEEKPKDVTKPSKTDKDPALPAKAGTPEPPTAAKDAVKDGGLKEEIHAGSPPGRQDPHKFDATPSAIHWVSQTEHFPVPTKSIIQLPTGEPVKIPQIQHVFKEETADAKALREKRQSEIREEFMRAWSGYKKQAWMHDELSPVSGGFRDPFSGWAATLVDSLDTLWIMGLQEEFEEAAKAVDQIDFTISTRDNIQLFETTIRYLGGLVGAYDVSGQKYKNLLVKAEELATVLMGAFDTPNRMPILYYQWKPAYASQPHRASQNSNLAELGSLSLEFTRLAQLTKNPRYYDAVARITEALADFQNRTKVPGLFPPGVDASGCNKTAPAPHEVSTVEEPEGYNPNKPADTTLSKESEDLKAMQDFKVSSKDSKASEDSKVAGPKELSKRDIAPRYPPQQMPSDLQRAKHDIGVTLGDWDCRPGGLESSISMGTDRFSMGGNQDSTYEYFPKEYLLLGGRVDTYRELYLNTIQAIRKWLLYRPMVPGSRDILFAGSFTTDGRNPEKDGYHAYETEHLTCFIGGMVGMSAKIFDIEGDLEIAKKLADGCVWAYGSMNSEIMAESAEVMPCESMDHCTWNETAYHYYLDPTGDDRDRKVEEYLTKKAAESDKKATEDAEKSNVDKKTTADDKSVQGDNKTKDEKTDSEKAAEALAAAAESKGSADTGPKKAKEEARSISNATMSSVEKRAYDPQKPLTHKEYVEDHIKKNSLPPGYVRIRAKNYILRPEAIESVWYMYRLTGDPSWQAKGWKMYEAVIRATSTNYGHTAVFDVTQEQPTPLNQMESFWLAETLKYFYLLFSTPDTISLDDWVLNTEAHPFKREK